MSVILDLSLAPADMMFKLLTLSTTKLPTGVSFTANDLTYNAPVAVAGRNDGTNTVITFTPIPASTIVYGDPKTLYYARKDFNTVLVQHGLPLAVTDDLNNWTTTSAPSTVLSLLQSGLSSHFLASDISVGSPVTNTDGTVSVPVALVDSYLTMVGSVTFVVTASENRVNSADIPSELNGLS